VFVGVVFTYSEIIIVFVFYSSLQSLLSVDSSCIIVISRY